MAQLRPLAVSPLTPRINAEPTKADIGLLAAYLFLKCDVENRKVVTAPAGSLPLSHYIRLLPSKFRRDFVILGDGGL